MNILPKIKIDFTTYFLILSSLFCGWFKNIILIILIILFHELGHVYFITKYHYSIIEIRLYPFGGITQTKIPINTSIKKSIIIASGGILFQIILFIIMSFLYHISFIRYSIYSLFNKYNLSIILFNLLPIIPLDGSIIFKNILAKYYSYHLCNILISIISFLMLIIYLSLNYLYKINNYMIAGILLYKSITFVHKIPYFQNLLYLERYLYKIPFNKIKYINHKENIKLDTYHYIKKNNIYLKEEDYLAKLFDNT